MSKRKLEQSDDQNESEFIQNQYEIDLKSTKKNSNLLSPNNPESVSKIKKIIEAHFDEEIEYKKHELDKINERIFEAQNMLDKLRVCIICNFYSQNGRLSQNEYINHPAIAELKCEHLEAALAHARVVNRIIKSNSTGENSDIKSTTKNMADTDNLNNAENSNSFEEQIQDYDYNMQLFKVRICVGNVSKYLKKSDNQSNNPVNSSSLSSANIESSQYNQDLITHKWMIYIRSPNCVKLDNYIKKCIFYLHSSYKPYDLVEIKNAPFQLIRRGWGEFPIHVQIHFKDARNKRVDISHNLKLDWTQTGLQTFGGETTLDVDLVMKKHDVIELLDNSSKISSSNQAHLETLTPSNSYSRLSQLSQDIDKAEQEQLDEPKSLPRNLSSSSLSSTSSFSLPTNTAEPRMLNRSESVTPIPVPTAPAVQIETLKPADNILPTPQPLAIEPKIPLSKSTSSLDDLLNLRPKSILSKLTSIKSISPFNTATKILPNSIGSNINTTSLPSQVIVVNNNNIKPVQSQIPPQITLNPSLSALLNNKPIKPSPQIPIQPPQSQPVQSKPQNNTGTNNKRVVIYKVESSDVNNSSNFNSSSSSSQITSIVNNNNNTDKNNLVLTNTKCELLTNKIDTSLNLNNNYNNNITDKPDQQKLETIIEEPDKNTNEIISDDSNKSKAFSLLYSSQFLKENTNLDWNLDFESIMKRIIRKYPLVANFNSHISKRSSLLPFCARNLNDFYKWPYAKRRANEWMRALYVKRKCIELGKIEKAWSTKSIVIWLRSHGYTPLENKHILRQNQIGSQSGYVDSLSTLNKLIDLRELNFSDADCRPDLNDADENFIIDIVNNDEKKVSNIQNESINTDAECAAELNDNNENSVDMCEGSKHVKEQLDLLNIKANTVNLVANSENPQESNIYSCNLVEKFLFVIAKRFSEDLIRNTAADIYFDSSKSVDIKENTQNGTEMRRGVGIGAINKKALQQTKFEEKATEISENEMSQLAKQVETFKKNLEEFAFKYKDEIRSNAQFRKQFQDMCANIGVDPLASSKGFWSEIIGVSDFYYELAVQIIEICNSMQERTGGLVYLDQVLDKIRKVRSRHVNEVSLDDCRRAIKKLNVFGNAFTLILMNNGRYMIQSVPEGMSVDHTQVLKLAEANNGIVDSRLISDELKWDSVRIQNVFNFMIKEGIVWIDKYNKGTTIKISYYFPSLFNSENL